jgi:5-methylcytosine-specific restriction endonuclease McrA
MERGETARMNARPYGQRGQIALPGWRKDAEGRALCRWCDAPVPKGRKSWCSRKCVDEWRERGDWNHIRNRIIERDKVCRMCGDRRWEANYVANRGVAPDYAPYTVIRKATWEVDHIVAVEDGGTDDPANLRLLCRPCHKERTALQRREKALARRGQLTLVLGGATDTATGELK